MRYEDTEDLIFDQVRKKEEGNKIELGASLWGEIRTGKRKSSPGRLLRENKTRRRRKGGWGRTLS